MPVTSSSDDDASPPTRRRIARLWWPLAASWLLMGAELPLLTAFVARMDEAKVHLAAYGSLVFPLALVIESPIIMLLAASTSLCADWASYVKVRRFMLAAGAVLTALHVAIAFSPLFDWIAVHVIDAPPETIEPGRIGFRILTPWTWSIAYRRFQQGVLIRTEHSRRIGAGTLVRLGANLVVLSAGYAWNLGSGIAVGASAVSAGVVCEALFIGASVQSVLRTRLKPAPPAARPLTRAAFVHFYAPLALTPLVTLLAQPIGAAAMSRMIAPIASLATWPALHGLVFLARAFGLAYNEVVVALIGKPGSQRALRGFAWQLGFATSAALALVALTPLSDLWFAGWSHLDPDLARAGATALLFAIPLPLLNSVQSYFQGALVQAHRTRAITEATALSLLITIAVLAPCVALSDWPGLPCAVAALVAGNLGQTLWLAARCAGAEK